MRVSARIAFGLMSLFLTAHALGVPGLDYSVNDVPAGGFVENMALDAFGNLYTTGTTTPYTGVFLSKYDPAGKLLWQRTYASRVANGISRVVVPTQTGGDVYIAGAIDPNGTQTNTNGFIAKYDSSGNLQWDFIFNGIANGNDQIVDMVVDPNDQPYAVGFTNNGPGQGLNVLVLKLTSGGAATWEKSADINSNGLGTSNDIGTSIRFDQSGDIVVAGTTDYVDFATKTDHTHTFAGKYAPSGALLGSTLFQQGAQDVCTGLAIGPDNTIFLEAQSVGAVSADCIAKYDSSFSQQWVETLSNGQFDVPDGIAVDPASGDSAICGYSLIGGKVFATGALYAPDGTLIRNLGQVVANDRTDAIARVAFGSDGTLYMSARGGSGNGHFVRNTLYAPNGTLNWTQDLATGDPFLSTLTLGPSGDFYVGGQATGGRPAWFARYRQLQANADGPYTTPANQTLSVTAAQGVLANDLYVTADVTLSVATQPKNGSLSLAQDGSFTYIPNSNFTGPDSFTYVESKPGVSASANVNLQVQAQLSSLTFLPATLAGGNNTAGTITLTGQATAASGAYTIGLSYDSTALSGPGTVIVPVGSSTAGFTVSTQAVTATTPHTVTATFQGASINGSFTLTPVALASISVQPNPTPGGTTAAGTVSLNGPAPAPIVVNLASTLKDAKLSAGSTTIATGASSAQFSISTSAVGAVESGQISANYNGVTVQIPFAISPPYLVSFHLSTTAIPSGAAVTGQVTLSTPVPTAGITVSLLYGTGLTGPASVLVGASGAATFPVHAATVSSQVSTSVIAKLGTASLRANASIVPYVLTSLSFSPKSIYGTYGSTGKIQLNQPAPAGGLTVSITGTATISVPVSVKIGVGASYSTFLAKTGQTSATITRSIVATLSGKSVAGTITLQPLPIASVTFTSNKVLAGDTDSGSVNLGIKVGPYSTAFIYLTSSNPSVASVPSGVYVAPGAISQGFVLTAHAVETVTNVTITAHFGTLSKSTVVAVYP